MTGERGNRGGYMSLYSNWVPGRMSLPYDEPMYQDMHFLVHSYLTTPEAVAAALPEPLEPGPRPWVAAVFADYPTMLGWDGSNHPYNEFMFLVECRFGDEVGLAMPFIYVGSRTGDFTEGADMAMAMGRESYGFPKKLGNIAIEYSEGRCMATFARKGTRLVSFSARFTREDSPANSPFASARRVLTVKEIVDGSFARFAVRQVWASSSAFVASAHSMTTGDGRLDLGHLDDDPLALLRVVEPQASFELRSEHGGSAPVEPPEMLADLLAERGD